MKSTDDEIAKARQKRPKKAGFSMDEIVRKAAKEFRENKHIKAKEPEGFASGDMEKATKGDDHDKD